MKWEDDLLKDSVADSIEEFDAVLIGTVELVAV